jgi:hypothetical protein
MGPEMRKMDQGEGHGLDRPGAGLPLSQGRGWDWRVVVLELVIVFVGLFAALQLESWREQRAFREDQRRLLERLHDELTTHVDFVQNVQAFLEVSLDATSHVYASLDAGEILGGDEARFEFGLIYFSSHLPVNRLPRSTYEEMVSSGMFTALDSHELSREISALMNLDAFMADNFSWWRMGSLELFDDLKRKVVYYDDASGEGVPELAAALEFLGEQPGRRVRYDFEALAADPEVRNGFYWSRDTVSDWLGFTRALSRSAASVATLIETELGE